MPSPVLPAGTECLSVTWRWRSSVLSSNPARLCANSEAKDGCRSSLGLVCKTETDDSPYFMVTPVGLLKQCRHMFALISCYSGDSITRCISQTGL